MTDLRSNLDRLQLDSITSADQHDQWDALLNQTFNVPMDKHFFDDFPVWKINSTPSPHLKAGVYQGRLLVASAAARIAPIKFGAKVFPVALIGGVATYEEFRGRGLATHLVKALVEWADNHGAAASVLWGSEVSLYSKIGFECAGLQSRVALSSLTSAFPSGLHLNRGFHPHILRLMMQRKGGIALENKDLLWLSSHKNVEWFWLGDEEPIAYAAYGRGIDLPGLIHEWGGETRDLLELFGHIRGLYPEAQLLASPFELQSRKILFDETQAEVLCLARPGPRFPEVGDDFNALWFWGLDSV